MPVRPKWHRPLRPKTKRAPDPRRPSSGMYDYRWQQCRRQFLRRHPLCSACLSEGTLTPATEVDHVRPHRGDERLFWDEANWQALCKPCHSRKTISGQ